MKRLLAILPLAVSVANAQCVMCFRTAAAQQVERAKVLNLGIIIMMIPPIVIVAGFLYLLWRRNSVYATDGKISHSENLHPLAAGACDTGDGATRE